MIIEIPLNKQLSGSDGIRTKVLHNQGSLRIGLIGDRRSRYSRSVALVISLPKLLPLGKQERKNGSNLLPGPFPEDLTSVCAVISMCLDPLGDYVDSTARSKDWTRIFHRHTCPSHEK